MKSLQHHVDHCTQCQPSVLTADKACSIGRMLLREHWEFMKHQGEEWYENHPEEWEYGFPRVRTPQISNELIKDE